MRPDVSAQVGAIHESWQRHQSIVVRGSTGSGVHTLASDLSSQARCAVVELRALSQDDTSAALVLETASHLDSRQAVVSALARPSEAASLIARAINDEDRALVLVIPRANDTQDEHRLLERLRTVTRPLQQVKRLALLGSADFDPAWLGLSANREASLAARLVELAPTEFPVGKYRESAEQLRGILHSLSLSPLVWRLAVGLISQGGALREVASLCELSTTEALPQLSRELARRIDTNEALKLATQQLLLARRPLPGTFVSSFQLGDDQPFLTHCLGYGDPVRVAEPVRLSLLRALPPPSPFSHAGHASLATHYRALDGVLSPQQVQSPAGMEAWLEKVHHLALGGPDSTEWQSNQLPSPEFYWARARSLSHAGDFLGAAAIYEACSARFPDDDYSLHYAAWNRWQAGERTPSLTLKYGEAVGRNPTNPWWNQRHLAALITLGQHELARREWRAALNRIDPDGQQAESPWLFENLHLPVASAWNRVSCWHDALKTLGAPGKRFAHHREVKELSEQITKTEAQVWSQLYGWLAAHQDPRWRQARALVDKLRSQFSSLPVPSATTGEDDVPVLEWSLDDAVVVLEFGSGVTWSASDRKSASEGGELTAERAPESLVNWLSRISRV